MAEETQEQEQEQAQQVTFNLDASVALIHRCIATSSATDEAKGRAATQLEVMAQWMLNAQAALNKAESLLDDSQGDIENALEIAKSALKATE